jgi:hypothetical protein
MTILSLPCGVPWPVCSDCLGQGLSSSAGMATCPRCFRSWPVAEVVPCRWPQSAVLVDADGNQRLICRSHAAHPSAAGLQPVTKEPTS